MGVKNPGIGNRGDMNSFFWKIQPVQECVALWKP